MFHFCAILFGEDMVNDTGRATTSKHKQTLQRGKLKARPKTLVSPKISEEKINTNNNPDLLETTQWNTMALNAAIEDE